MREGKRMSEGVWQGVWSTGGGLRVARGKSDVNQTFGLVGKGAEPVKLFVEHAQRLQAAGL